MDGQQDIEEYHFLPFAPAHGADGEYPQPERMRLLQYDLQELKYSEIERFCQFLIRYLLRVDTFHRERELLTVLPFKHFALHSS